MNIADQLSKIVVLLADDRLVAVLKQRAMAVMAAIIGLGIPGEEAPHKRGQPVRATAHYKMGMGGQQRPGINRGLERERELTEPVDKVTAIVDIVHDLPSLDAAEDDMMEGARGIQAGGAGHRLSSSFKCPFPSKKVNKFNNVPYSHERTSPTSTFRTIVRRTLPGKDIIDAVKEATQRLLPRRTCKPTSSSSPTGYDQPRYNLSKLSIGIHQINRIIEDVAIEVGIAASEADGIFGGDELRIVS